MSQLPIKIKEKALNLRTKGYSVKEISDKLNISKSTSSLWVRNINLNKKAQIRLKKRNFLGCYKTSLRWRKKRIEEEKEYRKLSLNLFKKFKRDVSHNKIYCALLFWCEGGKRSLGEVRFTNSDPLLIKSFLTLLRKSFTINEEKFRAVMHLHKYHNENQQKQYWSYITKIPKNQFQKTYFKPNTTKRIRNNYPGCIAIKYYNTKVAKELQAIYKIFSEKMGV